MEGGVEEGWRGRRAMERGLMVRKRVKRGRNGWGEKGRGTFVLPKELNTELTFPQLFCSHEMREKMSDTRKLLSIHRNREQSHF